MVFPPSSVRPSQPNDPNNYEGANGTDRDLKFESLEDEPTRKIKNIVLFA